MKQTRISLWKEFQTNCSHIHTNTQSFLLSILNSLLINLLQLLQATISCQYCINYWQILAPQRSRNIALNFKNFKKIRVSVQTIQSQAWQRVHHFHYGTAAGKKIFQNFCFQSFSEKIQRLGKLCFD